MGFAPTSHARAPKRWARIASLHEEVLHFQRLVEDLQDLAVAEAGALVLERERIDLGATVARIVGAQAEITIGQLLEHRSGMGDIFGAKYDAAPPSRLRELADFVPLFAAEPLAFEPGSSQRYSNAGYVTLGLIVERLSGEKYRDYVAKHIFAPAKMASIGLWALDEQVARRAIGYTRRGRDGELPAPGAEHRPSLGPAIVGGRRVRDRGRSAAILERARRRQAPVAEVDELDDQRILQRRPALAIDRLGRWCRRSQRDHRDRRGLGRGRDRQPRSTVRDRRGARCDGDHSRPRATRMAGLEPARFVISPSRAIVRALG